MRYLVTARKQTKKVYYTGESMTPDPLQALPLAYYSTAEVRLAELKAKHKELGAWTIERIIA